MKNSRSGFTLVELMLTVALIAIVGLLAAPNLLSSVAKYRADGAARTLAGEMQLARTRAVSSHHTQRATFDTAAQTILFEEETSPGVWQTVKTLAMDDQLPSISLGYSSGTVLTGGAPITKAVSFGSSGSQEAVFFPNATLADSGVFYLIPTADIGKTNSRMRAVQVGLAGKVGVYRHKAGVSPPWEEF